jgi:ATP-binding cassette subfamily C protein
VIIVAHRKSAIEAVDQLLYLEAGSQQLFGPKDEVLRSIAESSQKAASQKQARLAASAAEQ